MVQQRRLLRIKLLRIRSKKKSTNAYL
jgi:hypothetical protein